MFSFARFLEGVEAGEENPSMGRALSREEVTVLVNHAMQSFRRRPYAELLSCFNQQELWHLLGLQVTEDDGNHEKMLGDAISRGDKEKVLKIASDSLAFALYTLLQNPRSAIHDIMVTDGFSPEAEAEYVLLAERFQLRAPVQQSAVVHDAPVDPLDQVVEDYRHMGTAQFQKKYMNDTKLRPLFDQAVAQGRI